MSSCRLTSRLLLSSALLSLFAGLGPSSAEAGRDHPDRPSAVVLDLTREARRPLAFHMALPAGVWAYADDRVVGRIEQDATSSFALKYLRDARATGWAAQAYIAAFDLRRDGEAQLATEAGRREPPAAMAAYVAALPGAYEDAGWAMRAKPGTMKVGKTLRAGTTRVPMWYTDLVVSWLQGGERAARATHVNVYGMVVRDWLIVVRIHLGTTDHTSAFLDGMRFSVRAKRPKAMREIKFTSVTGERRETRVTVTLPKDFERVLDAPAATGRVGIWLRRGRGGKRTGALSLHRETSRLDVARDLAMVKDLQGEPLSSAFEPLGGAEREALHMHVAVAPGEDADGEPAQVALAYFRVGEHRYTLRLVVPVSAKREAKLHEREWRAVLHSLRAWHTGPQVGR